MAVIKARFSPLGKIITLTGKLALRNSARELKKQNNKINKLNELPAEALNNATIEKLPVSVFGTVAADDKFSRISIWRTIYL